MLDKETPLLKREQFETFVSSFCSASKINFDYLYKVYFQATESIKALQNSNVFKEQIVLNPFSLAQYAVGEYLYSTANRSGEDLQNFHNSERFFSQMVQVTADKYVTLENLGIHEEKYVNRYLPNISSLNVYLTFMSRILKSFNNKNKRYSLIADLLERSITISKSSIELLLDGFETQAFSCWRTLHECECILLIFGKYGDVVMDAYNKHFTYGKVYHKGPSEDDENNAIFQQMKNEMKELNLKAKDIKKYVEYGWLYSIPGVKEDATFKLNFRDGLQKLAGMTNKSSQYELSSEIVHSTPILIYSNKQYFFYLTLLSLYETFFNLEKVFVSLFKKAVDPTLFSQYENMKKVYYQQLISIFEREANNFNKMFNKN